MKGSVHLIQASVVLYGRSHFSLSIEARRLRHTLAAFPNPPESDMTRGVKEPCVLSLLLVHGSWHAHVSCMSEVGSVDGWMGHVEKLLRVCPVSFVYRFVVQVYHHFSFMCYSTYKINIWLQR